MIDPVYKDSFVTLYHADCLQLLPILQADICITDPPYNISHEKGIKGLKGHKDQTASMGEWDKGWNPQPFISSLQHMPIVCFTSHRLFGSMYELLMKRYLQAEFAVWHKTNPAPSVRQSSYLSTCELLLLGGKTVVNWGGGTADSKKQQEMHNHFEGPTCMGLERTDHPTQKPLWLMSRLVEVHSKAGQTILDPYCGTGTTLLAARELQRKAIGIEQDEKWVAVAIERLSTGQKMRMF